MFNSGKITFLETSNEVFNNRQKSVFDELDKLENSRPKNRYSEEDFLDAEQRSKKLKVGCSSSDTKELVGQESIFKTPGAPLPSKKGWVARMPDYQVNPHKWTRYSLSDVSDVTDRGNTAAAMSFLRDRGSVVDVKKSSRIEIAPKFNKFSQKINLAPPDRSKPPPEHPLFQSSKRVMPEYVVGQKVPKKSGDKAKPAEVSKSQIKLDHLFDNEDDE